MIKYIYALFLGLLLSIFIGVGIATFYPGPTQPNYDNLSKPLSNEPTTEELARQDELNRQQEAYQKDLSHYNRNVSLVSLAGAVLLLIVALAVSTKLTVIADGLLLGGVFTLLYSLALGLSTQDLRYRFIITSAGLLAALFVGYWKFLRAEQPAR